VILQNDPKKAAPRPYWRRNLGAASWSIHWEKHNAYSQTNTEKASVMLLYTN